MSAIEQAARAYAATIRAHDEAFQFRDWDSVEILAETRDEALETLLQAVEVEPAESNFLGLLEGLGRDRICHGLVTRDGIEDACHKPAVGYARPGDDETHPWPACAWHLNRWGGLPLSEWHTWGVLP